MSENQNEAAASEQKLCERYDPDMISSELDKLELTRPEYMRGMAKFLIFSAIGIAVFFGSINGSTIFSILYNGFVDFFGDFIWWILLVVITFNFCTHVYVRYIKKHTKNPDKYNFITSAYENDGPFKTILFAIGVVFIFIWCMYINVPALGFDSLQVIVGPSTGENVFPPIVKGVAGILVVGAVFVPLLTSYGVLELVGVLLEPLMRPLFKIPGKAALDCSASFVGSASLGVIITNRLWKNNVYTDREMVCIMTGFSACSIGYVALVFDTAGVGAYFGILYILNFLMVFAISFFTVRIPPLSRHPDVYYNGKEQTEEERKEGLRYSTKTIPLGFNRGVKRAAISRGFFTNIKNSLRDSVGIMPQVLTMLSVVGLGAMIVANYTEIFNWVGYVFRPYVSLLQIPDVALVAPTMMAGISEMFVPVLMIADKVPEMDIMSRAFIALVSNAQVIFFSETAIVMLATKSPVKATELVVAFIERTIIAMPIASIIVHILF